MTGGTRVGSAVGALVFVALASCTSGSSAPDTRAPDPLAGGTLHVAAVAPSYFAFDPQASYTVVEWEILRCCLVRTLMTYRGVPDSAGTQPVPDLATDPPTVSADGLTWTFHLKHDLHYAPPFQDVAITATDVQRALLRSARGIGPDDGAAATYLPLIDGYAEYAAGEADAIAGVVTPDDYTLQVRETQPDRSLVNLFALPMTAPIPPSPVEPSAPLGAATGHDWLHVGEQPKKAGYGPFLVASGPYMIQGADQIDYAAAASEQQPAEGLEPAWMDGQTGHLTLVRNPSWSSATDPNRPAYADQIDVAIVPDSDPYPGLLTGTTDVVMGQYTPQKQLSRYQRSPELRDRIHQVSANGTHYISMNLAQSPFDDVHVRRAFALTLDRPAAERGTNLDASVSLTTHLVPDAMESSLLASWNPSGDSGQDPAELARIEMDKSKYGKDGRCDAPQCHDVVIAASPDHDVSAIRQTLGRLGISTTLSPHDGDCNPKFHIAMCSYQGWFVDYPNAGNMFVPFVTINTYDTTLLGATSAQLSHLGYKVSQVPSIAVDYQQCSGALVQAAPLCWARLDQRLTASLVAVVPLDNPDVIRLAGRNVVAFSIDQAYGEPSLDRVAVRPRTEGDES